MDKLEMKARNEHMKPWQDIVDGAPQQARVVHDGGCTNGQHKGGVFNEHEQTILDRNILSSFIFNSITFT